MANLLDMANSVPLMFRAQVEGRCQVQRLIPKAPEQDAERWVDEWVDKAYPEAPGFGEGVQTRTYSISWRFITNSGQDDGVIRPVIGARGWPFYPGSSMKGLFRQSAERMEQTGELSPGTCNRYCGNEAKLNPGILRFHGGYPTDTRWTENLVDIVHPQQQWQVKSNQKEGGAFIQISLYKPELTFGISSTKDLTDEDWDEIWTIWAAALLWVLVAGLVPGTVNQKNTPAKFFTAPNSGARARRPNLSTAPESFGPISFVPLFGAMPSASLAG